MEAYSEASRRVFEIFRDTSPEVEGLSIDEAFLDVSGLARLVGPDAEVARRLRDRVRHEVGLPLSVGAASTKFLAKVASTVSKPDGLLVVAPGDELAFLHPLPVGRLWGVGPVAEARLAALGVRTVGDVAELDRHHLVSHLGSAWGSHLHALAHNLDPRPVDTGRRRRSIGSQRSFPAGTVDRPAAEQLLLEVVDRVTARLRGADRVARTVVLRLRYGDFAGATRSRTVFQATASTAAVWGVATDLLAEAWPTIAERGLTKIGVAVTGLSDASTVQLALPFTKHDPERLDAAVDEIRDRFGSTSVVRTRLLGREPVEMPMLPD